MLQLLLLQGNLLQHLVAGNQRMRHRLGRTQVRQVLIQQVRANTLRKLSDQVRAHNRRGRLQQVITGLR